MNSSIPSPVKKEIHKVLLSNSGGVQLVNFSNEYKQLTGHDLDYSSFGFRSLKELLVSMPDVARVVLVTKCKTEKVYGVAERSQTSMNVSEKKGLGTTKDDKPLLTSNTKDRKGSFSKAGSPKDSLRQFVEKNIKCNRKGLWSLCFLSKKPISNKDVYHIFSPFGPVAEINISKRYAFVRFKTKEDAINAYVHLKEELGLEIASERTCMAEPRMKHNMVQNHSNDASAVHTQQKNDHHIRKGHLDGNHLSNHTKSIGHSIVDKHVRSAIINGLGSYQVSDTIGRGRWKQESLSVSGSSNQTQGAVVARTLNDRISMPELTSTRDDEEFDDMPSLEDIDDVPAFEGDHQQCDEEQISINDQSFNNEPGKRLQPRDAMKFAAGAIAGAVAAPYLVPFVVGGLGFTAAGIQAGSLAASMMSWSGGAVASGSVVATLQSVGAAGLGTVGTVFSSAVGAIVGGSVADKCFENDDTE